jgi:hypothetical protein
MHKSYHSFLTAVMDPLFGKSVYQLLTIEDLSILPTACIYLLFMVLRINSDYFANNVACVMGIQGFYRFLSYCLGEIYVWSGQQWASEINTAVVWLLIFEAKCHGENHHHHHRHYHTTTTTTIVMTSPSPMFLSPNLLHKISWSLFPTIGMA